MKKISIPCDFGNKRVNTPIYVGQPEKEHHPIAHQASWLASERGGTVPSEVMKSLQDIKDIADKNGVPFEELCVYAVTTAAETGEIKSQLSEQNSADAQAIALETSEDANTDDANDKPENNTKN